MTPEHIARLVKIRRALRLAPSKPRRGRLPRQAHPSAITLSYATALLGLVHSAQEALEPLIAELPRLLASAARDRRHDAGEGKRIAELMEQARERMRRALVQRDVTALAARFAKQTADFNRGQLGKQIRAALGVDVFAQDRRLPAMLEGFVSENVALIRNMPQRLLDEVEQSVTRAVQSATPHPTLALEIQERIGVSESRARLIARDQIGKAYGQINASRQRELGVREFVWRTSNDERVRPEHERLNGQTFAFDDPPDEGLPGEAINCRCNAEPIFDAVLAALG